MKKDNKIFTENRIDQNFNYFKKCIKKWQEKLNLNDYEIVISIFNSNSNRAEQVTNIQSRICSIKVDKDFLKNSTHTQIEKTAFHECLEILLSHINIDMNRFYSSEYTEERIHEIIRVFENIFFCVLLDNQNE